MTTDPRVMFLGDVHGNVGFMFAAIDVARRMGAQAILQVGDFGFWTHIPAGVRFLDETDKQLQAAGITLIFADGNHCNFSHLYEIPVDDDGFRRVRPSIWHAPRGLVWFMAGVSFQALGGAHSIDAWPEFGGIWNPNHHPNRTPGSGWWPEEALTPEDVQHAIRTAEEFAPIDVMITHDAPEGIDIPGIEGYPAGNRNRRLLAEAIEAIQPQLVVAGHYHKRHSGMFGQTSVEILAHDSAKRGNYLLLNLDPLELLIEARS